VRQLRQAAARPQTRAASGNGAAHSANGDGEYDYDLFTIGAGSGGVRASRFAASTYGAPALCCRLGVRRHNVQGKCRCKPTF